MTRVTVKDIFVMVENVEPQWTDIDDIAEDLQCRTEHCYNAHNDGTTLVEKPFDQWMCWDTYVGKSMIFLSGVPVAIRTQTARKSIAEYFWLGEVAIKTTSDYIRTLGDGDRVGDLNYINTETVIELEADEIGDSRSSRKWLRDN